MLTAPWLHERSIAGIATDTWGAEVRPNELPGSFQPLHLVRVVNMGLLVGEIFDLEALADDCAVKRQPALLARVDEIWRLIEEEVRSGLTPRVARAPATAA
jgi:hypothetical protein